LGPDGSCDEDSLNSAKIEQKVGEISTAIFFKFCRY
jgi:hypothetical protein